jgi:P27 family predicted phage terminase small subunit
MRISFKKVCSHTQMGLRICVPLNGNEVVAVPFRASLEAFKGDPMNGDLIKLPKARTSGDALLSFEQRQSTAMRTASAMPPSFLIDEIAREEWERVAASLFEQGLASLAQRSLLAGYCNAVARAVRAEHILTVEGRYYETKTRRGSVMRRRHPAAQDAEEGWTAARHLAKQLGLVGGSLGERRGECSRQRFFK